MWKKLLLYLLSNFHKLNIFLLPKWILKIKITISLCWFVSLLLGICWEHFRNFLKRHENILRTWWEHQNPKICVFIFLNIH
jgi:hypothetical protein